MYKLTIVSFVAIVLLGSVCVYCEKAKEGEYCVPECKKDDEDYDDCRKPTEKIKEAWRVYCGAGLTCDLDLVPEEEREYGQKALGKCKSTKPIKAVIEDTDELSTFLEALKKSDLLTTLQPVRGSRSGGAIPKQGFTVLAPTNDAFDDFLNILGITSLDSIPPAILKDILKYYVIQSPKETRTPLELDLGSPRELDLGSPRTLPAGNNVKVTMEKSTTLLKNGEEVPSMKSTFTFTNTGFESEADILMTIFTADSAIEMIDTVLLPEGIDDLFTVLDKPGSFSLSKAGSP